MFWLVSGSILVGLAGGLGGYLATYGAVYLALFIRKGEGSHFSSRRRQLLYAMHYAAAWSIWFVPAGMLVVLTYCGPDTIWWAVVIGGMSPLLFIYLPLLWRYVWRRQRPPGIEWSAWEHYDPTAHYTLVNGR